MAALLVRAKSRIDKWSIGLEPSQVGVSRGLRIERLVWPIQSLKSLAQLDVVLWGRDHSGE
jgi:hypothetical protein